MPCHAMPCQEWGTPGLCPPQNFMHISHKGGESVAKSLERVTTDILRLSTRMANQKAAIEVRRPLRPLRIHRIPGP